MLCLSESRADPQRDDAKGKKHRSRQEPLARAVSNPLGRPIPPIYRREARSRKRSRGEAFAVHACDFSQYRGSGVELESGKNTNSKTTEPNQSTTHKNCKIPICPFHLLLEGCSRTPG